MDKISITIEGLIAIIKSNNLSQSTKKKAFDIIENTLDKVIIVPTKQVQKNKMIVE